MVGVGQVTPLAIYQVVVNENAALIPRRAMQCLLLSHEAEGPRCHPACFGVSYGLTGQCSITSNGLD
uniref:Uncharacterized protein n=1 Tax=Anguilla anguilla TaxID=7936 RepID=A0A0E9XLA4_ANGAN